METAPDLVLMGDPMDCSLPGSSVHGFSRQEYWSGVPWVVYRESELLLPNPHPTAPVFRLYFLQESRPLAHTAGFNKAPF